MEGRAAQLMPGRIQRVSVDDYSSMESVGAGSSADAPEIPTEILDAVESWLVDPRSSQRTSRRSSRPVAGPLDADLSSFLTRNGLT